MTRSTGVGRHPPSRRTHGQSFVGGKATVEYQAWSSMKRRCLNRSSSNWPLYGGRGITICSDWAASFEVFLADMGPRPGPGYSLERINNELGYSAENCKWATALEQSRNRRFIRRILLGGEAMCLTAACQRLGISRSTGNRWIKSGRLASTVVGR